MIVPLIVQAAFGYFIFVRFATLSGLYICSFVLFGLFFVCQSCLVFSVYMYFVSVEMVNKILYYTIL